MAAEVLYALCDTFPIITAMCAALKWTLTNTKITRSEGIPLRSFQNWCSGERTPAPYLERWIIEKIEEYAKKRESEE